MRIKKFAPEEEFSSNPFVKPKKIRINEEFDVDEAIVEEDILEGIAPWERAFELGAQMANDELSEE